MQGNSDAAHRRPSLQGVAARAGVSASTISRYLNGHLNLVTETEQRVLAAMDELGYVPKTASRRPVPGPTGRTVAIVIPRLSNPYFADLAEHLVDAALTRGLMAAVVTRYDHTLHDDGTQALLASDHVAGIVYAGTHQNHQGLEQLVKTGTSAVAIAEPVEGVQVDTVRVDDHSGAHQAVTYLRRLGHERIALIGGPEWLGSNREADRGFSDALAQSGVDPARQIRMFGDISSDFGVAAVSRLLLSDEQRPTAVFVTADEIALGVYAGAKDLGLEIPAELSVVSSDDIGLSRHLTPPLTTVRVPRERMADAAMSMLTTRILGENRQPPETIALPVRLIVRDSALAPSAPPS